MSMRARLSSIVCAIVEKMKWQMSLIYVTRRRCRGLFICVPSIRQKDQTTQNVALFAHLQCYLFSRVCLIVWHFLFSHNEMDCSMTFANRASATSWSRVINQWLTQWLRVCQYSDLIYGSKLQFHEQLIRSFPNFSSLSLDSIRSHVLLSKFHRKACSLIVKW